MFKERTVMVAEMVLLVLPVAPAPSNITSSTDVGTEASLAPPEVALQFVGAVAFQFADDPPPTQYLVAIYYILIISFISLSKYRSSKVV